MTDEPELRAKPELLNDLSGTNYGNVVQAGQINGDVYTSVHTTNNHVVQPTSPAPVLGPLDRWLATAGGLAIGLGVLVFLVLTGRAGGSWPPLLGIGASADASFNSGLGAGLWFAFWQVWTGWDLLNRRWQWHGRDRHVAQVALWLSLVPVYVAVGVPAVWVVLFLVAAAIALISLLHGPRQLHPRWFTAAAVVAVASLGWFWPEFGLLWSQDNTSVVWQVLGTALLLPIVAVPVYAVLTASADHAARVLRGWSFCLAVKIAVTLVIMLDAVPLVRVPGNTLILVACGVAGMLVIARNVRVNGAEA
ncbi:hypothetical protein LFM09_12785 [Lentzea alba]|uniref:hypothetical protein n=1 Tax=Lentzea alba TaxID=2714351 RepID=UPI0039BF9CCD